MLIFLPMPVFKRVSRSRLWDTICAAVVAVPSSGLPVVPDVVVPSAAGGPVAGPEGPDGAADRQTAVQQHLSL